MNNSIHPSAKSTALRLDITKLYIAKFLSFSIAVPDWLTEHVSIDTLCQKTSSKGSTLPCLPSQTEHPAVNCGIAARQAGTGTTTQTTSLQHSHPPLQNLARYRVQPLLHPFAVMRVCGAAKKRRRGNVPKPSG